MPGCPRSFRGSRSAQTWRPGGRRREARQDSQSITLQPIDSAARQLVQLSLHYLVNQPERICVVSQDTQLPGTEAIAASPRMIAFMDVPPGTRFLPQAAELNDGRVVTFFSPLAEKLQRHGGTLPVAYPDNTTTDTGRAQRDAYWNWFADHWNADKAVTVMEEVIGIGGRPRWIAYRMSFPGRHHDAAPGCVRSRRLRHRRLRLQLHPPRRAIRTENRWQPEIAACPKRAGRLRQIGAQLHGNQVHAPS